MKECNHYALVPEKLLDFDLSTYAWWIDSGTTLHVTNSMQGFLTSRPPVRGVNKASSRERGYVYAWRLWGLSLNFTLEEMALPLGKGIDLLTAKQGHSILRICHLPIRAIR